MSVKRKTYLEWELDRHRTNLDATGPDEPILEEAAQKSLKANEFMAILNAAMRRREYGVLHTLVLTRSVAYPAGIQELRSWVSARHASLLASPYGPNEQADLEREPLKTWTWWWAACDACLLMGLPDRNERITRLPAIEERLPAAFVDDVIEAGRPSDSGVSPSLRELFSDLRDGGAGTMDQIDAIRGRLDPFADSAVDAPEVWDSVWDALAFKFIQGGHRRALLTLPAVAKYLRQTARNAAGAVSKRPHTESLSTTFWHARWTMTKEPLSAIEFGTRGVGKSLSNGKTMRSYPGRLT